MTRTNIHLSVKQIASLKERSEATGLPVAELIRRAIDAYLMGTAFAFGEPSE